MVPAAMRNTIKRAFDIAVALIALILAAPVMIGVALLVYIRIGRPILFRQLRPGLGGTPFVLLKFRTMRDAVDPTGQPLPDAERLSPFGAFLRATSLDELPSLFNILKGDMSVVGPRPLLMEYLPLYSPFQARRHETRPGLTGWAQVNGRNGITWHQKFAHDVWYVDNHSLWLDLRICWRTARIVLARDGISADGAVTMPRFEGGGA
jgi:lipopolysaccharide/colanic/teichoic acid biosynthesis glycosyltransferase